MMEQKMNTAADSLRSQYISSEVRFYTVRDLMDMSGWSEKTVQQLFNDPEFPSSDFGRAQIVEAHALIDYFSVKRAKEAYKTREKGELKNELRKRIR